MKDGIRIIQMNIDENSNQSEEVRLTQMTKAAG